MAEFVLVTAGYGTDIHVLDAVDSRLKLKVKYHDRVVNALALSNGSKPVMKGSDPLFLAVAGTDVAVFDVDMPETAVPSPDFPLYMQEPPKIVSDPLLVYKGHSAPVTAVGFDARSPMPRFGFSASEDGFLKVWDPKLQVCNEGKPASTPSSAAVETLAVFFRPDEFPRPMVSGAVLYTGSLVMGFRRDHAIGTPGELSCPEGEMDIDSDIDTPKSRATSESVEASGSGGGIGDKAVGNAEGGAGNEPAREESDESVREETAIFITADARGRLSMWDYHSGCLLGTVRPHAVFEEETQKAHGDESEEEEEGTTEEVPNFKDMSEAELLAWFSAEHPGWRDLANTMGADASSAAASSSACAGDRRSAQSPSSPPPKARFPRDFQSSETEHARRKNHTYSGNPAAGSDPRLKGPFKSKYTEVPPPSIDRHGGHLATLALFPSFDGSCTMLVTSDLRGNIFLYKVPDMLANERAPPYATWNATTHPTPKARSTPMHLSPHKPAVYVHKTRVSEDGKFLVCAFNTGTLRSYDLLSDLGRFLDGTLKNMPFRSEYQDHYGAVWDVAFLTDNFWSCSSDGRVLMWDIRDVDNENPAFYEKRKHPVTCLVAKELYIPTENDGNSQEA